MANPSGKFPLFETVRAKKKIINGMGATQTLSADDTGSTVVFDRAAGTIVTLPVAVPGLVYDFEVTTSVTSNNFKVITGAATEFLIGSVVNLKTDFTTLFSIGNGSTHIAIVMNGTTTGGLLGTKLRFTCLSATRWQVEGTNLASGVIATPFSTT